MDECCSEEKCCCSCKSCNCSCHAKETCGSEEGDMSFYFLELADEAWSEVLKDKIKEHILATQNDRMTELAKIVAEGNNARWRHKMEKKQGCMDFKEKLCQFFSRPKK